MAVHTFPVEDARDRVVELAGRLETRSSRQRSPAPLADTPVILALQLEAVDSFVEMVRLRGELADREQHTADLSAALGWWRDRATSEEAKRKQDAREAHGREREIISLLHQQMQVAESATAELERISARPWWRRLLG